MACPSNCLSVAFFFPNDFATLIPIMARGSLLPLLVAATLAVFAIRDLLSVTFVGVSSSAKVGAVSSIPRSVGVDYLLRNGPKDADPPLINPASAAGPAHEVTFKKRPFGIARYAPGAAGTGAVVMEVTPKSRYPGDPQGQAFVAGVQPGWVVKAVNGQDVTGVPFEGIMESLDDEVLDPVAALSLNLKESGTVTNFDSSTTADKSYGSVGESTFQFGGGQKAELPITVTYVEQR